MKKNNILVKKIFAAAAAGALLITLPMAGCSNEGDTKESSKNSSDTTSQTTQPEAAETKFGGNVIAKSKNYSLPFSVFQYLYNYNYKSFTSTYGTSMIDTSKSLSEQYYDQDNKITWHDYFVQATQDYISYIMTFAEAAADNGVVFTAADNKEIEDGLKNIEEVAKESSLTIDEYFKKTYGDSIATDDIKNIQKLSKLGLKCRNKINDSYTFTEEEYEAKFDENKSANQVADYYVFGFEFTEQNESQTSTVVNEQKKKEMKEHADALANCKTGKEFTDYVTKFLKANPDLVPMASSSSESSMTEESFNSLLDSYVSSLHQTKVAYNNSNDVAQWLFDTARKEGDTKIVEEDTSYSVLMVSKPLYRDEEQTRNIRHILITTDSVESDGEVTDEQVKAKAEEIYNSWKNGEATEEKFAELANQYSTDSGSNTTGGIYKNVTQGQMVPAFNDWMFDKNRKPGDSGIVKTDYGYHIMYYVGAGLKSWQMNIDTSLREAKLAADYEQMKTKYNVEFDETAIKKAQLETSEEESAESSSGAANLAQ